MARTALVTGGAAGIGLAISRDLLGNGDNVVIVDRNRAAAADTMEELSTSFGDRVLFQQADVTHFDELAAAFKATKDKYGRVDIVFPIAGISQALAEPDGKDPFSKRARLDDSGNISAPNFFLLDVNLRGVISTVHLAIAYFRAQDPDAHGVRGRVVAAASVAALYSFPNEPLYGAAKHGVLGLVRSLGPAVFEEGIFVNCVAPSLVETSIGNGEAFAHMRKHNAITPMETVLRGVRMLIEPEAKLAGHIAECCLDTVALRLPLVPMNEDERRCLDQMSAQSARDKAFHVPKEISERGGTIVIP